LQVSRQRRASQRATARASQLPSLYVVCTAAVFLSEPPLGGCLEIRNPIPWPSSVGGFYRRLWPAQMVRSSRRRSHWSPASAAYLFRDCKFLRQRGLRVEGSERRSPSTVNSTCDPLKGYRGRAGASTVHGMKETLYTSPLCGPQRRWQLSIRQPDLAPTWDRQGSRAVNMTFKDESSFRQQVNATLAHGEDLAPLVAMLQKSKRFTWEHRMLADEQAVAFGWVS
jgi:hypothetical protein